MTKLKKLKRKYLISVGLFIFVAVVAISISVRAFSSQEAPNTVMENVNIDVYNEAPIVQEAPPQEFLGGNNPNSYWNYESVNGDVTYHLTGDFINASTTIVSVINPFRAATSSPNDVVVTSFGELINGMGQTGATSTVELVRLNVPAGTVATSSWITTCGAAPSPGGEAQAYSIISSGTVATSSPIVLENDITGSYGAGITSGSVDKIMLDAKNPYLVCKVTDPLGGTANMGAFTEVTNTFGGKYLIRISRTRF